ncbi:14753_t:CDS:2, partial [Acaulospora colombiana]
DGLRADKLYQLYQDEHDEDKFFTVPTESRPGHVAIIAGFYEDVSAVTKGWKTNPVEFDSVFNQSRHTWSFGSPDILPMFAEGASDPTRVDAIMYSHDSENFAEDATKLDTWVFNQFSQLLANSSSDPDLHRKIHDDQIVIFLHLLGLDTNGHAYGPHSKEYINNIKVVDEGIRKTVKLLEDFYGNDGKTAYIFTADHGMSNRGNHGDGHPDNTRTPIIAWGAGIKKPNKTHPTGHDEFSEEWGLESVQRNDILQADIAPLMVGLVVLSAVIVYDTTNKLRAKAGLPFVNQVVAWIILAATPFAYGLRTPQHYLQRLSTIILAFSPLFVLLSISYEVLFYYSLSITLVIWHQIEKLLFNFEQLSPPLKSRESRKLQLRDSRVSLIFLFFIKVAFFGTGNVASLASFSLQSVYRLTTIFNPFLMGALLLFKIIIPFFVVTSVFGVINKSLNLPLFSLFLLVLSTSDIMTLNFFYLVRDDGSWLEIGTTISHFVISSLFSLFMILLFLLSEILVGKTLVDEREGEGRKVK